MKSRIKRLWVEALRSGEYAQGRGALVRKGAGYDRFCCLGVLVDLYVQEVGDVRIWERGDGSFPNTGTLPHTVVRWAGLKDTNPFLGNLEATYLNDAREASFCAIANRIEKYL